MTPGLGVMLFGVFVVPAILLWAGHKLRRRSPAWRQAFWGAVLGHVVAVVIGSIAAMKPAAEWSDADVWRGVFGYWSFAVAPAIGAVVGAVRGRRGAA
ncbi:MAG: hypothetical protein IT361_10580 [Gemmatimonadaceae bacterium]|nr:hypothetical protein [Gemmatimonadaceae bacterium]